MVKYLSSTQEVEFRIVPISMGSSSFVAKPTLELLHLGLTLLYSAKSTFVVFFSEVHACHPTGLITLVKSLF